jgi:multiple sugar transport system permease protein
MYKRTAYLMIIPVLFILLLLMVYPVGLSIYTSLTDRRIGTSGKFVGLDTYRRIVNQPFFVRTLINSGLYVSISLTLKTIFGLLLALLLHHIPAGRNFLRAIVLLPWVVPTSMSVLIWQWMFDPSFSVLNWILTQLGLNRVSWLGAPFWARLAVITVNVWRGIPFFSIALGAGLTAIPQELYESASIDGATSIQQFFRITLPLLTPVFNIVLLYSLVMTIADFDIVYILTRGGPFQSTHLLGTLAYQVGLPGTQISQGAAISLFIFPILLVAAFFALRTVISQEI